MFGAKAAGAGTCFEDGAPVARAWGEAQLRQPAPGGFGYLLHLADGERIGGGHAGLSPPVRRPLHKCNCREM
jgi:hypothetical protein